jgi:hypothetical protein
MKRLWLVLLLGACRPSHVVKMDSEKPVLGECGVPELFALLGPPVHQVDGYPAPLPPGYADGERLFAAAEAQYRSRAFLESARGFMRAAGQFVGGTPEQADTVAANRIVAYRNAGIAWGAANQLDEARRELGARARSDVRCAAELERIARDLTAYRCSAAQR